MKLEDACRILQKNQAVLNTFQVKELYIFGSVARNESVESSDIDIMGEFEKEAQVGLFDFVRLKRRLSELLGCEVDLTTRDALHHSLKEEILREAVHAA